MLESVAPIGLVRRSKTEMVGSEISDVDEALRTELLAMADRDERRRAELLAAAPALPATAAGSGAPW